MSDLEMTLSEVVEAAIREQRYLPSERLDPTWIAGWNAATENARYVARKAIAGSSEVNR